MNTLIVTATRSKLEDFHKTPLWKSISSNNILDFWLPIDCITKNTTFISPTFIQYYNSQIKFNNTDIIIFTENKEGLSKCYNFVLDYIVSQTYKDNSDHLKYDTVIFVHDDVTIQSSDMLYKLEQGFGEGNSVLGLAGASSIELKEPVLWHLISKKCDWSGAVNHPNYGIDKAGNIVKIDDTVVLSNFGPVPKRCLVIDSLFIAVKVIDILAKNIRFNPELDFHLLDLDFSLTCNKNQLKISTVDILVTHESPGLRSIEDPCFQKNQKLFLQKWKANGV